MCKSKGEDDGGEQTSLGVVRRGRGITVKRDKGSEDRRASRQCDRYKSSRGSGRGMSLSRILS